MSVSLAVQISLLVVLFVLILRFRPPARFAWVAPFSIGMFFGVLSIIEGPRPHLLFAFLGLLMAAKFWKRYLDSAVLR